MRTVMVLCLSCSSALHQVLKLFKCGYAIVVIRCLLQVERLTILGNYGLVLSLQMSQR